MDSTLKSMRFIFKLGESYPNLLELSDNILLGTIKIEVIGFLIGDDIDTIKAGSLLYRKPRLI
jgi:hypothetical protein